MTAFSEFLKLLLDKGMSPGSLLGFILVAYFLREGLAFAKSYAACRDDERGELVSLIRATQDKQNGREDGFVRALEGLHSSMAKLADSMEAFDHSHKEIREKLDHIDRGVWRG